MNLYGLVTILKLNVGRGYVIHNHKWAKLPKSGKLEKSEKNYNFLKLVPNVVNFFLHFVKYDIGLGNNYFKSAPSFIFF